MGRTGLRSLLAPTAVLLIGAAARIAPLTDNRFHPDEALFASYGRLISTYDWNLSSRLVDKPPLLFYITSLSFQRVGPNEVAARLPNLAASMVALSLVWLLAMRLWGRRDVALLALLFVALSPMAVLFAPTAFTDPLLVTWILAGLVAVTGGRWGWGGVFAGLALATKQTALFFLPLIVALGLLQDREGVSHWRSLLRRMVRFVTPVVAVVGVLVAWDATRSDVTGFWRVGVENNAPGRLARPDELWLRLREWAGWLRYVGGWLPANVGIVAAVVGLAVYRSRLREEGSAWTEVALVGFTVAYLGAHWLAAFNIYDRYLLPLVPLLGLLVGRSAGLLLSRRRELAVIGLAGLLAWPAVQAGRSRYPVGGDHGAYDGIERVAVYLDALPDDTIIYDHWLGWLLDFYLFDSPAYTTYFETPEALRESIEAQPGGQFAVLLMPGWAEADWVLDAIRRAGSEAHLVYETSNRFGETTLRVFTLAPPAGDSSE